MTSIRKTLAQEAADAEARRDEAPTQMRRAEKSNSGTSQVYTVRMPADRLAELRAVADQTDEQPSALMRRWVLERLDDERTRQPDLATVRRTLNDALHTLDQLSDKRSA
jgi:hypothetical protein